jgi:SAM-dependent methyltransferase
VSVYGAAARRYVEHSLTSPHNALYERPAMRALLGDVHGLAVLDVGCGGGSLMRAMLDAGAARVAGIESDPEIARFARTNAAAGLEIVEADAESPFPSGWDGEFDVVVASLMLHYLPRWDAVLENIHRTLRPRGRLLFSVNHPGGADDDEASGDAVSEYWPTLDITVTTYRWTFRGISDVLARHGFDVERIVEPVPLAEMREQAPRVFDDLTRQPAFVLVGARKR